MRDQANPRQRRRNPGIADGDWRPVMVPRNDKALVPTAPERARHLRVHLIEASRAMRERGTSASPLRPEQTGFAARVVRAACTLCGGWCCRNGANNGFLDDQTLARAARDRPELDADGLLKLYLEKVPATGVENSCIFHGEHGCTLDRSLRSDVCNAYFCGGLYAYLAGGDTETATVVIAGEGDRLRTSSVLRP